MGKPRTMSDTPLKRNAPLELLGKLHKADDTQARRVLVEQANPFFYAFGETLRPWKSWLTYEENMEDVTVTKQIKRLIKGASK